MDVRLGARCASTLLLCLVNLVASQAASADTITVAWDRNALLVSGYAVYVTTPTGSTTRHDVGSATLFAYSKATAGLRYCFAVSAYLLPLLEGPKSSQVCGYSNAPPTLANPGNRTSGIGQSTSLQLQGSDPDGEAVWYSASGLPPGLSLMTGTGFISGAGTKVGTYTVTARVLDGVLSAAQSFTWTISKTSSTTSSTTTTSTTTTDTTAPTVTIAYPTSGTSYTTLSTSVTLSGTAADAKGVTLVGWANNRGGYGTASGTTSWKTGSIALLGGYNVITITARDAAGNRSTDAITVTFGTVTSTAPLQMTGLVANRTAPQPVGSTVTFTAAASGGTAPYQYKWLLYNGKSWVTLKDWSTSYKIGWTPWTASSLYQISVRVRNAGSTVDTTTASTSKTMLFPIK
jgi:hypothetical protein